MERDDAFNFWSAFSPTAFGRGRHFLTSAPRHQPSALDARSVRAWARGILSGSAITATEWARSAKLAPSTLNRFLASDSGSNLSASTLSRLIDAAREVDQHGALRQGDELITFGIPASHHIPIIAYLEDKPKCGFEYDQDEEFFIDVPVPKSFAGFNFGIEVTVDRYDDYPKGSLLICSLAMRTLEALHAGQKLILHQRTSDGVASSLRRVSIDPDGQRWLTRLAGDTDSKAFFFEDILPKGYSSDALVSYLVVSSLVPEPWLAGAE